MHSTLPEGIVIVPSYKVYVAASSRELTRAEAAMVALRDLGHVVTHDWVALVRSVGSANPPAASNLDRSTWANEDLHGVAAADYYWLLMPATDGFGAGVEFGFALGTSCRTIVSGPYRRTVFSALADKCYDTDIEALKAEFMQAFPT